MRRTTLLVTIGALGLTLGACGSGTVAEVNHPARTTQAPSTASPPTTTAPVAHVGDTLDLTNATATAAVTLVSVADPAAPDQYVTADPGKRFVGTTLTIKNTGADAIQGNANDNTTLVGSDGQTYTPDLHALSGCTDFAYGDYQLGVGESATGCVAFQMPTGVTVAKFKFSPAAGFAGDFGEWVVP